MCILVTALIVLRARDRHLSHTSSQHSEVLPERSQYTPASQIEEGDGEGRAFVALAGGSDESEEDDRKEETR